MESKSADLMRENDGEIADLVGVDRKSEDGDKLIEGVRKVVTGTLPWRPSPPSTR